MADERYSHAATEPGNDGSIAGGAKVSEGSTDFTLPGDYNDDNVVDSADYVVWRATHGSTTALEADGNRNGIVDDFDYDAWAAHFGESLDVGGGAANPPYRPAAVVVQTSGVTLPDGTTLNISGTQTQGLQEAFNYAAAEGWDVFVLGGTYSLTAHLDVPALQIRTFRFEDVTMNFSSSVTDYGIRFDSSMMLDWYWKGGAINAPNATHGVKFDPQSLHPLDGLIYGSRGTVETRAIFAVDITAQTYKVTMDTAPNGPGEVAVTINDSVFYFQNVATNQVNKVGTGFFSDTIIFDKSPWIRTDDPIPWDLFSPSGRVTVIPPICPIGTPDVCSYGLVYKPDGELLSISVSTTSGLQEAIDYAGANNLDLLVFGRGIRNVDPTGANTCMTVNGTQYCGQVGLYSLSSTLTIPTLASRKYIMYSVTLNWGGSAAIGPAIQIGNMQSSHFEITGQVVGVGTAAGGGPVIDTGVSIKPTTQEMKFNIVRIQQIALAETVTPIGVRFDSSMQTIEQNQFHFHEINDTQYGLVVANPGTDKYFRSNLVRAVHIHDYDFVGFQLGQSNASSSNRIVSNTVELGLNTDGRPADVGITVYGDQNGIEKFSAYNTGLSVGATFDQVTNGNTLFYTSTSIQAGTAWIDSGSGNNFVFVGSGSLVQLTDYALAAATLAKPASVAIRSGDLSTRSGFPEVPVGQSLLLSLSDLDSAWEEFGVEQYPLHPRAAEATNVEDANGDRLDVDLAIAFF